MGVFWSGIKRSRVHASVEKLSLLLEDAHGLRRRDEVCCNRLRQAAGCSDLPSGGTGLGRLFEHAMFSGLGTGLGRFCGVRRRRVSPSSQLDAHPRFPV